MLNVLNVLLNDEPEGKFLYTETIKLYIMVIKGVGVITTNLVDICVTTHVGIIA